MMQHATLGVMNEAGWYATLIRPSWAPPAWLFSPVWMVLYALIAISFGWVFWKAVQGALPWMVALPFALNLLFNAAFTPIQFGLQNNLLAALDILLVLGTLTWALVVIYPHAPWVTYLNVPYLLWVAFASVLQLSITYLNW